MMKTFRSYSLAMALFFAFGLSVVATPSISLAQSEADYVKEEVELGAWLKPSNRPYFQKVYGDRAFQPIWTANGQLNVRAIELRNAVLRAVPAHGLRVRDYWTNQIESFFQPNFDSRAWLAAEMALSKVFIDVSIQLNVGRVNPEAIATDIKFAQRSFTDWPELQAAANGAGIAALWDRLAPQHEGYKRLQIALARMQTIEKAGGFKALYAPKITLKKGSKNPVVKSLKLRAQAMGYLVSNVDDVFDEELEEHVQDIQEWNLAPSTGVLTPSDSQSWEWFAVSSARRIQQLELSMEKYRWLPRKLEERHIFVNLATQRLKLHDPTNTLDSVREMKTINGRPSRKTPSMRDETKHVVLNPTWGVPPRIFAEDKLTHIRELLTKGGYPAFDAWMNANRFHVMDETLTQRLAAGSIDWMNLDPKEAKFYIVQQPGYMNALGRAKILLGNAWFIYMHDTNERDLFLTAANRAKSSGCIRLERPIDMVEYLLRGTKWNRTELDAFVAKPGETKEKESWVKIPEANRIVVYTMSITSHVGDDNVIRFTQDVYAQNLAVLQSLQAAGFYKGKIDGEMGVI
ncbi:MAG: L,D-transpeptidase family protein, partial [Bdellovibrionota bacterium]